MGNPAGWDAVNNYKHPGGVTVRLTLFWTAGVKTDPAKTLVDVATRMLNEHGLGVDVYNTTLKSAAMTLASDKWMPIMSDEFNAHAAHLRGLCHQIYRDSRPRLPVILCPFSGARGDEPCDINGVTVKGTGWLPYVIINSELKAKDGVTLLHEIGHAADLGHTGKGSTDVVENFMTYGDNRTNMTVNQVKAIAKAYFAR
jgi:hypothetical protein